MFTFILQLLENIACLCLMLTNDFENKYFYFSSPAVLESLQTIQMNTISKLFPPQTQNNYLMFHLKILYAFIHILLLF